MNDKPDVSKLSRKVRDYIETLERERDSAMRNLEAAKNSLTPSPIYIDEWMAKPRFKRYIQPNWGQLCIEHADINLRVILSRPDDGQRPYGIELSYSGIDRLCDNSVAVYPHSIGTISLVNKKNVR